MTAAINSSTPLDRSASRTSRAQPLFLREDASQTVAEARPVNSIGVIGAGVRSAVLAEQLAEAGFTVTLYAESQELLDEVLAQLDARFEARVRDGELTSAGRKARTRLIEPTCWYVALSTVDAAIVCEEECEEALPRVLASLEGVMKNPAAILRTTATCTSENVTERLRELTGTCERTNS